MEKLSRDVEFAEYLIEAAKQKPETLLSKPIPASSKGKSIHQKLLELHIEECGRQEEQKGLISATNLLSKLVQREKLNCLMLKLYPANEGYSLMLRGRNGVESETFKLPYEVSELLDYVDDSSLPPFLVDLLEKAQVNVFYSGCVILEVRDYRRSTNGAYDTQHVLLKPTPQSLLSDIYNLTNDGHRWTQDDQYALESQLLLATEEPICLDPSPAVLLVANKLQYEQKKWNTPLLKRSVKKYTQAAINRKRKFAQMPAPKELKLYDFIHKKKFRSNPPVNLKVGKPHVDMWKQKPLQLSPPEVVEVEKYATSHDPPDPVPDNSFDILEEITLERDITSEKKILAKLCLKKRKADDCFWGELYLDHDYKEGSVGTSCCFPLGTRLSVDKYLAQFKEIFTEEGRRAVKITTQRPGQPPQIEYTQTSMTAATPGLNLSGSQAILTSHAASLSAAIKSQVVQADQATPTTAAGVMTAGKRNLPIQLSLTIAPAVPGGSSQAGSQLQLNIQKQTIAGQPQTLQQRSKALPQNLGQRTTSSTPSPVTTPTSTSMQGQIFSPNLVPTNSLQLGKTSISNITTPALSSAVTSSASLRKPLSEGTIVTQIPQAIPQGNITFVQSADTNTGQATLGQQPGIANINIANIAGLPPNINIQNIAGLPGMNIANLQGLQNMQVSLTGVSMQGGGIAVPVPISLITANSGVLQNQGIFVTSLPGVAVSSTGSGATTGATSGVSSSITVSRRPNTATSVTVPSLVTMVTSLPSVPSVATTSVTTSSHATTSGVLPTTNNVLAGGMLSPIIGLAPFMSAGIKPQAGTGIRQQSSVPLLQIQGNTGGIQLVNVQQQRPPLKTGNTGLTAQSGQVQVSSKTVTSIPTAAVQLTAAPNLTSPQMAALSQLKPTQTTSGTVQTQHLLQLQQIQLNKPIQQIQLKQPTVTQSMLTSAVGKPKSKKRTTPTPPKQ